MKQRCIHSIYLLLLVMICAFSASAQTEPTSRPPYRNNKIYTSDLSIDGAMLDKRIAKYYSENDLAAMKARKVNQLNYLYLKSFTVLNYDLLPADVKKYINESFDIGLYDKYRKAEEKAVVEVNADGRKFSVELVSRAEVSKTKENIQ